MLTKLLAAWVLMAACVVIHAGGVSVALRRMPEHFAAYQTFWRWTWLFVRIAGWIVLLHLFEIAAWGIFYVSTSAMSDVQSAMYFSAVTYTTTGYGDLVLPAEWRMVGGVEALTGILMCGWSTGFFFAVVTRLFESRAA